MERYIKDQVELHGGNPEPIGGYGDEDQETCEICKGYMQVRHFDRKDLCDYAYDDLCEEHKRQVDEWLDREVE